MYYLNADLLYLIPVFAVIAVGLVFFAFWRNLTVARAFGDWKLVKHSSKPVSLKLYILQAVLAASAAGLLALALARPVMPDGTQSIAHGTVDVVAVVDVSRSMAAMDYEGKVPLSAVATRPMDSDETTDRKVIEAQRKAMEEAGTRLEMVRHVIKTNMLKTLDGNQFGIVSYAGEAFPQAFLTRDTKTLSWVIDRGLTVSSAPGEGSAMGKALHLALAMYDADSPQDHERLLILFSDGGNDDEAKVLQEFAQEARKRNIKVLVVGMGNYMPSKIPVSKLAFDDDYAKSLLFHGKRWYEVNGQVEKTGMNAQVLQAVAGISGGQYIHLQDVGDLDLSAHVGKDVIESVPGSAELFPWVLLATFVSIILMVLVKNEIRGRQKRDTT